MTTTPTLKRLIYQSWHRGMKELDLVLGNFADHYLHTLPLKQQKEYAFLLQESDPDLWGWISGTTPLPQGERMPLLQMLSQFYQKP